MIEMSKPTISPESLSIISNGTKLGSVTACNVVLLS